MPYYEFKEEDLFYNTIETWPQVQFDINGNKVYLNNKNNITGAHVENVGHVPTGFVSLYELNVDRVSGSSAFPDVIYPFIIKDGDNNRFRGVTFTTVDGQNVLSDEAALPGDRLNAQYPMSNFQSLIFCHLKLGFGI